MSNRAVAVQKLRWSGMLEMYKGVGDFLCIKDWVSGHHTFERG